MVTSRTAARSFAAGLFFVEPLGFNMTVVSVLYNVAKSGLFWRTASSTGGNMVSLQSNPNGPAYLNRYFVVKGSSLWWVVGLAGH
jgi:hypothetical protein